MKWPRKTVLALPRSGRDVRTGVVWTSDSLSWTCMVCGVERPDKCIDVFTQESTLELGVRMRVNVRYCNDNSECEALAPDIALMETLSGA